MYSPVGGLFSWRGLGWREENKRKGEKAPSDGLDEQTSPITLFPCVLFKRKMCQIHLDTVLYDYLVSLRTTNVIYEIIYFDQSG